MGRRNSTNENESKNTKRKVTKKIDLKDKIKLDRNSVITVIVVAVLVITILCIKNYTSLGLVLNKNITSDNVTQIELTTSNNEIFSYGENILVLSKGKIICYTSHGNKDFEIELEDTLNVDVNTSGKYIQVINKDKAVVYVYKEKYEVARIKLDGKIYSGSINESGASVIEYTSNGNKTVLGVYDNKGNAKYNIKLANDIVGKYVLSENLRYLAYIDVNISGISAKTTVNLVNLNNITGESVDIKSIYESNGSIAYDIYFNGSKVITRFEEEYHIYNCASKEGKTQTISTGTITNIDNYDNRYAYLEINEKGNYVLNIRKMLSDSLKQVELSDTPKYFIYENGIAYVCYQKQILAFNNFGTQIKNYTSDIIVTEPIVFNDGRSVALSISNKIIMFTI